ncbi:GlxA family transcriptional regulator [Dyella japonica]|uniref:AraC family transcriptional regulator n=1 Tax=Dyella japonica DSM 16301 TaxID=1440762 RepID=A0A0G9H6L7_9GAMM|nr:GlxA family transcriptional regulator [Dyella japonica]KLD64879.1 AraC family transcriptional regulator [Dyella japonica DSM 16301]
MIRTIAILAFPGVQLLDVSGPLDVFAEANRRLGKTVYQPLVVGTSTRAIESSSGVRLMPDLTLRDPLPRFDTVLVAGAPGMAHAPVHLSALDWLRRAARRSRRYGSVCNGALVLAASGLIDGRRITTHWGVVEVMRERHPQIQVEPDALYLRDGPVCTAAGVTAGMDLALALVEEDLGRDVAMQVASELVMFFKRPGGQLQFSRHGEAELAGHAAIQELQRWIGAHPGEDHSVAALAKRAGLSPRHFARVFHQEVGVPPAEYVEQVRVEAARRLLELGQEPPKRVADMCGYADANGLRRAFMRQLGVTPADYRRMHRPAVVTEQ